MHSDRRSRLPSPALVISLVALFVGIGGAAYAVNLKRHDVKPRNIAPRAVKGGKLAPGAVKSGKLRAGAVTAGKLADQAVTTDVIADRAVRRKKIAPQAVGTPKLADGAVEGSKVAAGAIGSANLAEGAVTAGKLAAGSVTSASVLTAFSQTLDPASLPAQSCARTAISIPATAAVAPGDSVVVTPPAGLDPELVADADAAAAEVGLRLCNVSGGAIDAGPGDYRFLIIR